MRRIGAYILQPDGSLVAITPKQRKGRARQAVQSYRTPSLMMPGFLTGGDVVSINAGPDILASPTLARRRRRRRRTRQPAAKVTVRRVTPGTSGPDFARERALAGQIRLGEWN